MLQLDAVKGRSERWPELAFHWVIIDAIITGDCSQVITLGSNVAQATAQIFRTSRSVARFTKPIVTPAESQGLAVFILNGVPTAVEAPPADDAMLRFARGPIDVSLMRESEGVIQELACLHGIGPARHAEVLASAFDVGEKIILDALEMGYAYSL